MAALNYLFGRAMTSGDKAFARATGGYIDNRVLGVATVESHTPPVGANFVVFGATGDFWARANADPAVPAADVTDGTGSELNPVIWILDGVVTIRLISAAAQTISMSFYK